MEVRCALAQTNPTTGDVEGNTALVLEELDRAADAGVDVVAFPELMLTGYCILDLVEDDAFVTANLRALERVRDATEDVAAVVGFVDRDEGGKYNAAAVLQDGEVRGVARKVLLPNYRYFDDERYFEPGGPVAPVTVDVRGQAVDLGVAVCEDMWDARYERKPIPELARAGADVVVSVNASPFESGKRAVRHETIQRHVAETGLPFLYVNTVGAADVGRNVVVFDGDSLAYAADGALLEKGQQFAEDRVVVAVGGDAAVDGTRDLPVEDREAELYAALVTAVRDFAAKTGYERAVVPVDGGVDAALGLLVCADALGRENVLAYTTSGDGADTAELAETLGVEHRAVPVESLRETVVAAHEDAGGAVESEAARRNVEDRLGGLLARLAAEDAGDPALLVASTNETEMALGEGTLCGEMAGDLNPVGDLSQSDARDVAAHVAERREGQALPPAVLGPEQGGNERTVDAVVDALVEERCGPSELVARFESGDLDPGPYGEDGEGRTLYERYDSAEFGAVVFDTYRRLTAGTRKRVQAPPVVAVSSRAFGVDFREPIVNAWDGRPPDWS